MMRRKKTYKSGRKNFIKDIFYFILNSLTKDFKIKLFGFFFAIILWIYTILGNQYTHLFHVPLEIINIMDGKTMKETVPEKIEAEFSGKGSDLVFLYLTTASGFKFKLDLLTIKYFFNFNLMDYYQDYPENIIIPRSLDIVFNKIVTPDSIVIELDNKEVKKIPIEANVFIETRPGYLKTEELKIVPDSILITGPNFYVKQISKVYTDSLIIDDANLSVGTDLKLRISDNPIIKYSRKKVSISQKVEQISEKIIKDIPVRIINKDETVNIQIIPDKISLKVSGGLSHLSKVKSEDFEIYFDYGNSWQAGETYYTPEIIKPKYVVDIIDIIPARLNVRVIRERVSK